MSKPTRREFLEKTVRCAVGAGEDAGLFKLLSYASPPVSCRI